MIKPEDLKILSGNESLTAYQFSKHSPNYHNFCQHCGVRVFTKGYVEQIGGHFASISIPAIDNMTDQERSDLPIMYMNGKDNDWFNKPAVTKHL